MRWVIVACASLVACRGEQVGDPIEADASTDTSTDVAITDSGGCPTGKANLLLNGDFAAWAGTTPESWGINATAVGIERVVEGEATFARVTVKLTGNGPTQTINLPERLPKGCKLYFSGRSRYVSGPTAPTPDLFMYMYDAAGMNAPGTGGSFASYTTAWSSHTAVFTADRDIVRVEAYVLGNATAGVQVFDVDDLVVSYSPP